MRRRGSATAEVAWPSRSQKKPRCLGALSLNSQHRLLLPNAVLEYAQGKGSMGRGRQVQIPLGLVFLQDPLALQRE